MADLPNEVDGMTVAQHRAGADASTAAAGIARGAITNAERFVTENAALRAERDAALLERDQWRRTAMNKLELMNSTALREKDATIAYLTTRVAKLEGLAERVVSVEAALAEIYRIVPKHRVGEIARAALSKEPKP